MVHGLYVYIIVYSVYVYIYIYANHKRHCAATHSTVCFSSTALEIQLPPSSKRPPDSGHDSWHLGAGGSRFRCHSKNRTHV